MTLSNREKIEGIGGSIEVILDMTNGCVWRIEAQNVHKEKLSHTWQSSNYQAAKGVIDGITDIQKTSTVVVTIEDILMVPSSYRRFWVDWTNYDPNSISLGFARWIIGTPEKKESEFILILPYGKMRNVARVMHDFFN